jgi:uncharacterized protein (TIGR02266 family)
MLTEVEKRRFRRVPVELVAHCRIGARYVRDAISDLSVGGLFLKTREMVREGSEVRVALALPFAEGPRYCTLVGAVVRIERDARGQRGVGVSFGSDPTVHGYLSKLT